MNTIPMRGHYQGVLQILEFNWRMYVAAAACVAGAGFALPHLPAAARAALLVSLAPALFWMASSLVVSHYVYDCFPLYDLSWIRSALERTPRRWINIHSGLDETSGLLHAVFPDARGQTVDIFDARAMTEPSIRQARQTRCCAAPATPVRYDALPFSDGAFDSAFAIFAAHELRRHVQRVRLFQEIARILDGDGDLVLMEHSRDWRNFLAFGPGFLHFFARSAWRKAALDAGLAVRTEFSMTPFVRVYIMRRKP
ncbi:MAG: methyltransferase domain-containing protein [Terracidiphilus sp.]